MPSQEIEPSHQASVDLLEIRKPTNCVAFSARTVMINGDLGNAFELQDQDCNNGNPWIVCTISYGIGLGASIGKVPYTLHLNLEYHYVYSKQRMNRTMHTGT